MGQQNRGRYVCDTCRTVYIASMIPLFVRQPEEGHEEFHGLLSVEEAVYWKKLILLHTDPYWRGHQGVTTSNFIDGLNEFIRWRIRHKCHRVRTLVHNAPNPSGYRPERLEDEKIKP